MSLAYDASGVLDLCERVFKNDLELDCERNNERNTVRAKLRIGGTRYTIVYGYQMPGITAMGGFRLHF